ncbi:hypothetical protein AU493_16090 [Lonsdalea populi]|nr:hypothetical protein AU493_16090 [Lonsdalea populi]RAT64303.1 hypothetical protein AU503_13695 [Lonsdalea populi]
MRGADFRHKKRPQLRSIYMLLVPKAGLANDYIFMIFSNFKNNVDFIDHQFDPNVLYTTPFRKIFTPDIR